jgi:hypothetical protein
MKPEIDKVQFGSIVIEGKTFKHDVVIRLDGRVEKREKRLSKAIYGTSHVISLAEAEHVYEEGAERIIVGTGWFNSVRLSDEAADYFGQRNCQVDLLPTSEAVRFWNETEGAVIGLFHITC